jgi:hypothetical protein
MRGFFIIALLSGCVATQQSAAKAGRTVFDCAGESVKARLSGVLPRVSRAVSGPSLDWRAELADLARQMGSEMIACSLGHLAAAPTMHTLLPDPGPERAKVYLAEQDWQVSGI